MPVSAVPVSRAGGRGSRHVTGHPHTDNVRVFTTDSRGLWSRQGHRHLDLRGVKTTSAALRFDNVSLSVLE